MRLTEIKLDAEIWPRSREDKETVDRYSEIFEELPPIAVQKGTGRLIDGWHRFYAASKLGLREVEVEEVEVPDNLLFAEAVKRNLKHGFPLRKGERERAIRRLHEEGHKEHEIVELVGCSRVSVWRVLKAAKANTGHVSIETVPIQHRMVIADASPDKQPDIAKAVAEKKLTEKETKTLVQAMTSPLVTDVDREAMLHDPDTRPYLRDEKGEKIQSLDSVMRAVEMAKRKADEQATVQWWKTLQRLDKELSRYRPGEIAQRLNIPFLRLALDTGKVVTQWFQEFKVECAKRHYRQPVEGD